MPTRPVPVTASDAEKLRQLRKDTQAQNAWRSSVESGGVIGPPGRGNGSVSYRRPPEDGFWARITTNEQDEDPEAEEGDPLLYRWFYGFEEVYKKTTGYTKWETFDGAIKGNADDEEGYALNSLEDMNTSSGMTGSGININSLPTDQNAAPEDPPAFEVQPIPAGAIVWMRFVVCADGKIEFWFTAPNGIDGQCPAPPSE